MSNDSYLQEKLRLVQLISRMQAKKKTKQQQMLKKIKDQYKKL